MAISFLFLFIVLFSWVIVSSSSSIVFSFLILSDFKFIFNLSHFSTYSINFSFVNWAKIFFFFKSFSLIGIVILSIFSNSLIFISFKPPSPSFSLSLLFFFSSSSLSISFILSLSLFSSFSLFCILLTTVSISFS